MKIIEINKRGLFTAILSEAVILMTIFLVINATGTFIKAVLLISGIGIALLFFVVSASIQEE